MISGLVSNRDTVMFGISGNIPGVKIVKGLSVTVPFFQNGRPGEPRLRSFENKKLKELSVVMNRNTPFMIMIGLLQLALIGPFTTFHR